MYPKMANYSYKSPLLCRSLDLAKRRDASARDPVAAPAVSDSERGAAHSPQHL